jgi:hypothetical protein
MITMSFDKEPMPLLPGHFRNKRSKLRLSAGMEMNLWLLHKKHRTARLNKRFYENRQNLTDPIADVDNVSASSLALKANLELKWICSLVSA